jgi:hypothetical protein
MPIDRPARTGLLFCLLLLLPASGCKKAPKALAADAQTQADLLLLSYPDKEALNGFVGDFPELCIQDTESTELCQWQASDRSPGWRDMARAIGTRDRVNLICELPLSGSPRAKGSCSIHPRRSNRAAWESQKRTGKGARMASDTSRVQAQNRRTVSRWMAEADTLLAMSRLMGALPAECLSRSPMEQICTWRTNARTFGHGILAVWIDASKTKKIRLRCAFPKDGGPRSPESCHAQVGA